MLKYREPALGRVVFPPDGGRWYVLVVSRVVYVRAASFVLSSSSVI
jgi:hypothetical protein